MQHDRTFIPDEQVFLQANRITLADILERVEAEYTGTRLRDTRSAFRWLVTRIQVDLGKTIASPPALRLLFQRMDMAVSDLSAKRLANIRSCLTRAVETFGEQRAPLTKGIALLPSWEKLLDLASPLGQYRWGLSRLACYCSVKGIEPDDVSSETLRGLFTALEAEAVSKDPRNLVKRTIASWNHCQKKIPDWPKTRLSSPFKQAPYMMPLDALPKSFQQAVEDWDARMSNPDPLDPKAPVRALRPDTLDGYRFTFRRLATALVRSGEVQQEDITGFDIFFTEERFKIALRPFLKGDQVQTDGYAYKMATQMLAVGQHYLGLDEDRLAPFRAIAMRLKPKGGQQMGQRNRKRLEQFDDEEVVRRLLCFPEEELKRAIKAKSRVRQAKGVERALAISLAIFTGLRVKNLRQLRLDQNIRRAGKRVFIQISEEEAKTHASLELELPQETIDLLDIFAIEYRGDLPGSDGPYLFPGESGGARSYSAMRDALQRTLKKHAGITMSPHLYRHAIAKIIVERHPELALDVSRRLGHTSLNTTYRAYLGTEAPAASRRVNAILAGLKEDLS